MSSSENESIQLDFEGIKLKNRYQKPEQPNIHQKSLKEVVAKIAQILSAPVKTGLMRQLLKQIEVINNIDGLHDVMELILGLVDRYENFLLEKDRIIEKIIKKSNEDREKLSQKFNKDKQVAKTLLPKQINIVPKNVGNEELQIQKIVNFNPQKQKCQDFFMDLDSLEIVVDVNSLRFLFGMRALLSSSTERLGTKEQLASSFDLLEGPFIARLGKQCKEQIFRSLKDENIFCEKTDDISRITSHKRYVSTMKISQILVKLKILTIRIIAHGMKESYFNQLNWANFMHQSSTTRFDFGIVRSNQSIELFDYLDAKTTIYPLFGEKMGTMEFQIENKVKVKVYSTFIHLIKAISNLSFIISRKMTFESAKNRLKKIEILSQNLRNYIIGGTRIEITLIGIGNQFQNVENTAKTILPSIEKNMKAGKIVTKRDYLRRLQQLVGKGRQIIVGGSSKRINDQCYQYLRQLNQFIGITMKPLSQKSYLQQSDREETMFRTKEKTIKKAQRNKNGRFTKKNY